MYASIGTYDATSNSTVSPAVQHIQLFPSPIQKGAQVAALEVQTLSSKVG